MIKVELWVQRTLDLDLYRWSIIILGESSWINSVVILHRIPLNQSIEKF